MEGGPLGIRRLNFAKKGKKKFGPKFERTATAVVNLMFLYKYTMLGNGSIFYILITDTSSSQILILWFCEARRFNEQSRKGSFWVWLGKVSLSECSVSEQ